MIIGRSMVRSCDPQGRPYSAGSVWAQSRRLGWRVGVGAFVSGPYGHGLVFCGRAQKGWLLRLWRLGAAVRRLTAAELCAQPSTDGTEVGQ
jgi:hypothetical protein